MESSFMLIHPSDNLDQLYFVPLFTNFRLGYCGCHSNLLSICSWLLSVNIYLLNEQFVLCVVYITYYFT